MDPEAQPQPKGMTFAIPEQWEEFRAWRALWDANMPEPSEVIMCSACCKCGQAVNEIPFGLRSLSQLGASLGAVYEQQKAVGCSACKQIHMALSFYRLIGKKVESASGIPAVAPGLINGHYFAATEDPLVKRTVAPVKCYESGLWPCHYCFGVGVDI